MLPHRPNTDSSTNVIVFIFCISSLVIQSVSPDGVKKVFRWTTTWPIDDNYVTYKLVGPLSEGARHQTQMRSNKTLKEEVKSSLVESLTSRPQDSEAIPYRDMDSNLVLPEPPLVGPFIFHNFKDDAELDECLTNIGGKFGSSGDPDTDKDSIRSMSKFGCIPSKIFGLAKSKDPPKNGISHQSRGFLTKSDEKYKPFESDSPKFRPVFSSGSFKRTDRYKGGSASFPWAKAYAEADKETNVRYPWNRLKTFNEEAQGANDWRSAENKIGKKGHFVKVHGKDEVVGFDRKTKGFSKSVSNRGRPNNRGHPNIGSTVLQFDTKDAEFDTKDAEFDTKDAEFDTTSPMD